MFDLIFADIKGRFFDHPEIRMVGRLGTTFVEPVSEEMIPLPAGASLVLLPGKIPVGINRHGDFTLPDEQGKPMWAVGALLPQGYTRTLLPAYKDIDYKQLPLYGYAAVGWKEGEVYVAAHNTDAPEKWNPEHYNTPDLERRVEERLSEHKENRILKQLGKCAIQYSCFTAQNIFYGRWEGGIPVSPVCNARCIGCISEQPAECCPSPQSRIDFTPSVEEITEIAFAHLTSSPESIASFGQGCEGEPSLSWKVVGPSISRIRQRTSKGTINMNTNGGAVEGIKAICEAGIDSLRVSTVSAVEDTYKAYYRPSNYSFRDVKHSISLAKQAGVFVSLNLLTFPGLTDRENELSALVDMIDDLGIDMIQFRNLNIDPDYLLKMLPPGEDQTMGIPNLIECLSKEFPDLIIGSFSRPINR